MRKLKHESHHLPQFTRLVRDRKMKILLAQGGKGGLGLGGSSITQSFKWPSAELSLGSLHFPLKDTFFHSHDVAFSRINLF